MALPEGTSVTVEKELGKLTIKPYPAGYENTIKVVLEYMGEMMKISLMILMKQLEIHLMNSLNFTSTVEDLLKIKVCCIQKPTLIEIYEFNAFTNLMSLVLNTNKKKTLMSIQET
jgi:hypothetical protein